MPLSETICLLTHSGPFMQISSCQGVDAPPDPPFPGFLRVPSSTALFKGSRGISRDSPFFFPESQMPILLFLLLDLYLELSKLMHVSGLFFNRFYFFFFQFY